MPNDNVVKQAAKLGRKHAKQLAAPVVEAIKTSSDRSYQEGYAAGRAEALEEAAKIAGRYWHLSGTDCDDRDNCGIVVHHYRRPEYIAKLIRALANTPRY